MNTAEVAQLLALCASFDQRTVGEADVHAWHYAISDLDYRTAAAAVRDWYKANDEGRIDFQKLRAQVKRVRRDRLTARAMPVPDADPDDPVAYQQALAAQIGTIAAGYDLPAQLRQPAPPPPEITGRNGRDPAVVAALRITCPWCRAGRGERCRVPRTDTRLPAPHPARLDAAREAARTEEEK
ncbi:MAG TPA: hypothetical protein VFV01_47885 [Spirillospora sp.]|nr:hypothetical protein [Spirillospora sp.]